MKNQISNFAILGSFFLLVVSSIEAATISVRARMLSGSSDQLQLRINNNTVKTWTISGSSYANYTHTISGNNNVKIYFPDNGTDIQVDYIKVGSITYQSENQSVNTATWQGGSCGGSFSENMYCSGFIDFGTINTGGGGSAYVARNNFGAPFEPTNKILHGIGQHADDDNAQAQPMIYEGYISQVIGNREPVLYSCYTEVRDYGANKLQNRIDNMNATENNNSALQWNPVLGVGIKPWVNAVKNGQSSTVYEGYWEDIITKMINSGRKWYVRPGYEANGPWNDYDKSAYKTVFQFMAKRLRCRNVQAATIFNIAVGGASSSFMDWYPGDSYVDWFGINFFNNNGTTNSITTNLVNQAASRSKPIIICESTPKQDQVNNGQADWDKWFEPYFDWMKNNSEVKAFIYINWDWTQTNAWPTWGDCRIETNTTVKNNWISEISDPIFQHAKWTPAAITLSCNSDTYFRIENDGRDWWLQASGSNNNAYTTDQTATGDFTKWEQKAASGEWFFLENKGSGKRLKNGPTMASNTASDSQVQWKLVDAGNGYHRIQNKSSSQWLQASGSNNNTYMAGMSTTGPWTKWRFINLSGGSTNLKAEIKRIYSTDDNISFVFPNPSQSEINILFTGDEARIDVANIKGQHVTTQNAFGGSARLHLPKGLYLIAITASGKERVVKKVIIK